MIIAVASGKGGTGKTLVATSLALSIKTKMQVQLLDCDVEEPNDHLFLKPTITSSEPVCIPVPRVNYDRCTFCGECARVCAYKAIAVFPKGVLIFDQLCHGCGACSYLCAQSAIVEEDREVGVIEHGSAEGMEFIQGKLTVGEAMPTPVIRRVKKKINRDKIAILDVAPGTSCPVVESVRGSDYCLLVTEPTPFGLYDLKLAVETVRKLGIPFGVIVNRYSEGESLVHEYCRRERIAVLLDIPLDLEIARLYARGVTLAEGKPQWQSSFSDVFSKIRSSLYERNRHSKR